MATLSRNDIKFWYDENRSLDIGTGADWSSKLKPKGVKLLLNYKVKNLKQKYELTLKDFKQAITHSADYDLIVLPVRMPLSETQSSLMLLVYLDKPLGHTPYGLSYAQFLGKDFDNQQATFVNRGGILTTQNKNYLHICFDDADFQKLCNGELLKY